MKIRIGACFKIILIGFAFSALNAFARTANDPTYAADLIQFFQTTENEVKTNYPTAKLLFISTFISGKPDPACSQLGWQFVYQDEEKGVGIRKSIRHLSNTAGQCDYLPDSSLEVDKNDFPILGYQPIEGRLHFIKIKMDDALTTARISVGNNFVPYWLGLKTPLHPTARGKLYWSFRGPVSCEKIAEIFIDATSGNINTPLSYIPNCL